MILFLKSELNKELVLEIQKEWCNILYKVDELENNIKSLYDLIENYQLLFCLYKIMYKELGKWVQ